MLREKRSDVSKMKIPVTKLSGYMVNCQTFIKGKTRHTEMTRSQS